MKQDKHKAKRSARYKNQHGISSGKSENKSGKLTTTAKDAQRIKAKEKAVQIALQSIEIEKQREMHKEYSRRKIQSNWAKYDDFVVADEREAEVYSEPRGEDFQKLVSKSDDATSQLRMKDEVWWDEDDQQDETETEIGKLFKVDFVDVAQCLEAIPLHERLGISTKYFDEDLLNKINEDAAEHAKIYQDILDAENAQDTNVPASSDITNYQTSKGPSDPTLGASKDNCEIKRLQEVADKNRNEQMCNDALRTDSDREQCAKDMEQIESHVTDGRTPNTAASDNSCSHISTSSSTPGPLETSSNETTLSADVKKPDVALQTKRDEGENLEEWLDDILDLAD